MTNTELMLNMLAKAPTKDFSAATKPKDFEQSTPTNHTPSRYTAA
jgi:hypothetical protein